MARGAKISRESNQLGALLIGCCDLSLARERHLKKLWRIFGLEISRMVI